MFQYWTDVAHVFGMGSNAIIYDNILDRMNPILYKKSHILSIASDVFDFKI